MNEREAFEAWFENAVGVSFDGAKQRGAWDLSLIEAAYQAGRAAIEADRAQRVPDAAAERERIFGILTRADFSSSIIFRLYYPSLAGDWVDLCELRALLASTPAPAQQEHKNDELDFHSDVSIDGQQRGLACALALGQQVGRSRREGRSDPETEKTFRLAVTDIAKKIAIAVAKNCNSAPQLTFPDIYLGLFDLFSAHQEQPTPAPAQQERKPMTNEEIIPMFRVRVDMETVGEKDAWFWYAWGIEDAERHHGIKE